MKTKYAIFVVLVPLIFASCTQHYATERTITVSGTGRVYVTPDKASVSLSVITRDSDIQTAQKKNAEAMKRVQDALIESGIKREEIQTYDYGISQDSHWEKNERIYGKYNVTNRIKVSVPSVEQASGVIDTAVKNGATGVDSLSFKYEDEAKAVKRARTLAIENARAIAEESVQAAGATLGKVLVMQERNGSAMLRQNFASNSLSQSWSGAGYSPEAIMYEAYAAEEDAGGVATPLSTGRKEITVIMDMLYELK